MSYYLNYVIVLFLLVFSDSLCAFPFFTFPATFCYTFCCASRAGKRYSVITDFRSGSSQRDSEGSIAFGLPLVRYTRSYEPWLVLLLSGG